MGPTTRQLFHTVYIRLGVQDVDHSSALARQYIICRYMEKRPAFELKWPLVFWNSALAVFSALGLMRMGEEFRYGHILGLTRYDSAMFE